MVQKRQLVRFRACMAREAVRFKNLIHGILTFPTVEKQSRLSKDHVEACISHQTNTANARMFCRMDSAILHHSQTI